MKLKITNINIGLNTDGVGIPSDINEARIAVLDWNEEKYTEDVLTDGKLMEMVIHSNISVLAGYDIKFDVEVLPDNHIILEKHTVQDWSYGLSADNYNDVNYLPCDMFKLEYPQSLEFDVSTDEDITYLGDEYELTEEYTLEQYLAWAVITVYLPIKIFARLQ